MRFLQKSPDRWTLGCAVEEACGTGSEEEQSAGFGNRGRCRFRGDGQGVVHVRERLKLVKVKCSGQEGGRIGGARIEELTDEGQIVSEQLDSRPDEEDIAGEELHAAGCGDAVGGDQRRWDWREASDDTTGTGADKYVGGRCGEREGNGVASAGDDEIIDGVGVGG